jgi:hypothetical protein
METDSRKNATVAGVIGLLVAAALVTGLGAADALFERTGEPSWKDLSQREARSLEMGLAQMRRMQGRFDWIGSQPLASGALAAAALAAEVRPDAPKLREEAARWVAAVLDSCPSWGTNECGRAQLPLERLALQYPDSLPPELLARLRTAASKGLPPPSANLIQDPWSFSDTENQRMIVMARSLVAETMAGTPDSPAARGWGAFAEAFLKAHDRDGWYEAESPGYLAISINGLLLLADHAPQAAVRDLARRQLDLLFAAWAQNQVGGYPAGPKSRTSSVWALSRRSSPWEAWAWLAAGMGDPEKINFMDRPELAVSRYRIPDAVVGLLGGRSKQPPYEIRARRRIEPAKRRHVNTALYSYATPDYILGASQSVDDLALRVSGGQEIAATLFCESPEFAPLYLWSRTKTPKGNDANQLNTLDQAVASKNLVLARLETPGAGVGHAFLSPPWSQPEIAGNVVVSQCGDAYVALVTEGGWEVAPAMEKFPDYYGQGNRRRQDLAGSWVAVPRQQPASVALQAGRRATDGDFETWKKNAAKARLQVVAGEIQLTASDGTRLAFLPGRRATVAGKAIEAAAYPQLSSPFLNSPSPGRWLFAFEKSLLRFDPLQVPAGQK